MITPQIILIKADSHEEARSFVVDEISKMYGTSPDWSEWNCATEFYNKTTFAGSYADQFLGDKAVGDTLCYVDDPETAEAVIEDFLQVRAAAIQQFRKDIADLDLLNFTYNPVDLSPIRDMATFHKIAAYKELSKMLLDDWTRNSGVYDIYQDTANLRDFYRVRIAHNPSKQYLVLVEFH